MIFTNIGLKEKEYLNYINEHINNVQKAFDKYGKYLCKELDLNHYELGMQIKDHDQSKFSNEEFDIYRRKFFPYDYENEISDYEFNKAWLHHIHYNKHHPEYWIFNDDSEHKMYVYPMENKYIAEMILDWIAMGYKFNSKAYDYYDNKGKDKALAYSTRIKVEKILKDIKEIDGNG